MSCNLKSNSDFHSKKHGTLVFNEIFERCPFGHVQKKGNVKFKSWGTCPLITMLHSFQVIAKNSDTLAVSDLVKLKGPLGESHAYFFGDGEINYMRRFPFHYASIEW